MFRSVYDLKDFYASPSGGIVRSVLAHSIRTWWDNLKGFRVIGIGYTQPYLELFTGEAERVISVSPAFQGCYPWPDPQYNMAVLAEESELPLETNSVDRVLLVHSLEYAELQRSNLQEIWRVLKSNGRLIVVAPNRSGLWSRAEWSPFGHGSPFSKEQLRFVLRENLFVYERANTILFTPPLRWNLIQKASATFEKIGPYILPGLGGIHIVEASKQIYSGITATADAKVIVRGRSVAIARPVPEMSIRNDN